MFFYVKENKVLLDKLYEVIPEIIKLKETLEPDKLDRAFQYLHFVYSRKSPYFRSELNDRQKMVCADRFGEDKIQIWQKIENNADIKACIDKMSKMQFTENETFVEMARAKISEYITFWSKNKVNEANADIIRKQLEGVKDLINVKREFERNVMEDGLKKKEKSEDTKLFELPD
jgi:hypothetical protein